MNGKGNCFHNSAVESCFKSLKAELIVSGARTPSAFQVDGFWKAQGMRSSMRDAGWPLAMAVSVARR